MNFSDGVERRNCIRVVPEDKHPVRVDINGIDFIDVFHATEISEGGFSIKAPQAFRDCNLGQIISFVITLPQPERTLLKGHGRIQHITDNSYGIAFECTPYEVSCRIREYIALHVKEESWLLWLKYKMRLVA